MRPESGIAKFLRFLGILLMSLTAAFTILGGAGTSCAALFPTKWDSMAPLASFQWLYITYVVVTIAIGVLGVRAVVMLVKGKSSSYKASLIALILGIVVGITHIITSRNLRGSSMPVDAVVYITILTLLVFLLFRIPGIWKGVDFSKAPRKEGRKNGGAAAMVTGCLCLTIQFFMAPTHTWDGVNYASVFNTSLYVIGCSLVILGIGLLLMDSLVRHKVSRQLQNYR